MREGDIPHTLSKVLTAQAVALTLGATSCNATTSSIAVVEILLQCFKVTTDHVFSRHL